MINSKVDVFLCCKLAAVVSTINKLDRDAEKLYLIHLPAEKGNKKLGGENLNESLLSQK